MKLTAEQERMVHAFLLESGQAVKALSPAAQAQTLSHVRKRLRSELQQLPQERVEDDQLFQLLDRLRVTGTGWQRPPRETPKAEPAVVVRGEGARVQRGGDAAAARQTHRKRHQPLSSSRREWLGVCLSLSERFGFAPQAWRVVFVVAGLLTGPVALLIYLGLYAEQYHDAGGEAPRIDRARMGRVVGGAGAALIGMFVLTGAGLWAVDAVYERILHRPLTPGVWGNFRDNFALTFVGAAVAFLPFAVLTSLPLANGWDETLIKVLKAGYALFAFLLCLGFASYLAGALIEAARAWAG